MCNSATCAEYFKQQVAYDRCFQELRKKWRSYGKTAGRITLKNTTDEERRAIGGIVGKTFLEDPISFTFAEFEDGLQKTRFAPVDMKELLECYFGEAMGTNQEQRDKEQQKKQQFLESLCQYFTKEYSDTLIAYLWMREAADQSKYGYQLIIREYAKDADRAAVLVKRIGLALAKLQVRQVEIITQRGETETERPLAVFAAEISGNPHYFDRGTTAGQLLLHALCFWQDREMPKNAHEWRELLFDAGLTPDNISSMVHAYGLRLLTDTGVHPAYDAFCMLGEPFVLTLENMKGINGVSVCGSKVYIVENEMVFSYLLEYVKKQDVTILCTSGQLRSVALELIPLILTTGADVYYSGDLDPEGIDIADRLWQKYRDGTHIWRMRPEDYVQSISEEPISDARLTKLSRVQHPVLKETAMRVMQKQCAGYQENLLEELVGAIVEKQYGSSGGDRGRKAAHSGPHGTGIDRF